ncbi:amino acid ABC transporter substrate-binding protein [bacterium]|nr:MAG: amino acid ABC transporter substrate-binding protein [bacterium]QQR62223.1 MAG: amino acid ABC transporter substrate-binding protein [bacterium]QQR63215.1 MAG: amino acid ABC transporter substrate-binding protein [bacterium]
MIRNFSKKVLLLCWFTGMAIFWRYAFEKREPEPLIVTPARGLYIGTNAEFKPFSFIDKDGKLTGFDIEVMEEIGKIFGCPIHIKDLPFDVLIAELQNGSIDIIAAGITPTVTRTKQVVFTKPIFDGDPLVIISLKKYPIDTFEELKEKTVLVNEGYYADSFLSAYENINIIRLASALTTDGLLALESGRAEAFIGSYATTIPFLNKKNAHLFQHVLIEGTSEKDALALAKHNVEFAQQLNEAIDTLHNNGILDRLIDKWFQKRAYND